MVNNITPSILSETPGIICLEDDFALADNLSKVPYINGAFQSEMLILFICQKGNMQLTISDENKQMSAGDAFLCKPRQPILQVLSSSDCQVWVLFYSPHIVDFILPARHNLSKVLEGEFHPLIHFTENEADENIFVLLNMLRQRGSDPNLTFRSKTIYHLFSTLLFEVLNQCCKPLRLQEDKTNNNDQTSRADSIFKEFLKYLNEDGGCHRTVAFYADRLYISPKHLSKVIKEKSGNRTLDVINKHAMQQIKLDIKLTDTPIQQIAIKYNFSNFSFFCQYVKQHLGMTPQEYRGK